LRSNQTNDIRRQAKVCIHSSEYLGRNLVLPRSVCFPRFCHNDKPLRTEPLVRHAKSSYTASAHAFHFAGDLFHFLRIEITSTFDDHILDPSCDKKLAIGQIAEVTCVNPAVDAHHRGGGGDFE
jgi:hypothetical protein